MENSIHGEILSCTLPSFTTPLQIQWNENCHPRPICMIIVHKSPKWRQMYVEISDFVQMQPIRDVNNNKAINLKDVHLSDLNKENENYILWYLCHFTYEIRCFIVEGINSLYGTRVSLLSVSMPQNVFLSQTASKSVPKLSSLLERSQFGTRNTHVCFLR
jgi:hypothetical protein